jgi:hypothetical protein
MMMQLILRDRQKDERRKAFRNEVLNCLVTGLGFLRGETSEDAQRLGRRVLANIIIEHLEISGFAIQRQTMAETPALESAAPLS